MSHFNGRPSKTPASVVKAFEKLRADYDMSRKSRHVRHRTGTNPTGSGADYHYRTEADYYRDMEQARAMDLNDSLIGVLADRRVDNIVQGGFTYDPDTGDKALDKDLKERWNEEANDPDLCDIAGEMVWSDIERNACRAESIDGDQVIVGTQDGPFQIIEAHLVQTSSKVDDTFLGVTTDKFGKRLKYWVREELNVFGQKSEAVPLDVRNEAGIRQLFHVYNPKRSTMTRGVTQLAPVFGFSAMLEDINFAKLVQQQNVSMWAVLFEYPVAPAGNPPSSGYGDTSTELSPSGETRTIEGYTPGMEFHGYNGQKVTGFSPNVPNSEYFEQVRMITQLLGVNFGLPLCLVLMDGSETNFSGWRGAVDEARKGFEADQNNLIRRLHTPATRWRISHWMESDKALKKAGSKKGVDIFRHTWRAPTWKYIEPVADADGDAAQLKHGLNSRRRLHAQRGGADWGELNVEIIEDNSMAIRNAMKEADAIAKEFPNQPPASWRDLIPMSMPEGATIAMQDPAAIEVQKQQAAASEDTDPAPAPTGEYAGISRQQWNRNRKAINDILTELATGQTSEAAARVYLGGLGLAEASINALIDDAKDGSVDTPEVQTDVE